MATATLNPNITFAGAMDAAQRHIASFNFDQVNAKEAKKLMSEEHKVCGSHIETIQLPCTHMPCFLLDSSTVSSFSYRLVSSVSCHLGLALAPRHGLRHSARCRRGFARVPASRAAPQILGYRPPHDSIAAQAQRAAAKHPDAPGALGGDVSGAFELFTVVSISLLTCVHLRYHFVRWTITILTVTRDQTPCSR